MSLQSKYIYKIFSKIILFLLIMLIPLMKYFLLNNPVHVTDNLFGEIYKKE